MEGTADGEFIREMDWRSVLCLAVSGGDCVAFFAVSYVTRVVVQEVVGCEKGDDGILIYRPSSARGVDIWFAS